MAGNQNSGRPGPGPVVAAAMLDLLEVAVQALENDYAGQVVIEAIRATHAELARTLQHARWKPKGNHERNG